MSKEQENITHDLQKLQDPERASILSKFFKTGNGEYGEGDIFLGIKVPELRKIAKKHSGVLLDDIGILMKNNIHEYRLISLLILVLKYNKEDSNGKKEIVDFYLSNIKYVNNWILLIAQHHIFWVIFSLTKTNQYCTDWQDQTTCGSEE